mgnify:CR=1 FL=1
MDTRPNDPRAAIRKLNIAGFVGLALLVGGVGGWAATVPISGALIAPGSVVVDTNVKKVQHPTGGVIPDTSDERGARPHSCARHRLVQPLATCVFRISGCEQRPTRAGK